MMSLFCCWQDFILEHYSDDGNSFEEEIADLMDLRQVVNTHTPISQYMFLICCFTVVIFSFFRDK